jgi:hypothetical protein
MASFCTKCGAPVTPDKQFCTACGAPVAAAAAGSPAPGVVAYSSPAVAPANPNSSAVKIILIVVGVFVGLGILGAAIFAFTVWRFSRGIHVEGKGDKISLSTPGGTFSTSQSQTFSASELGVDPYPGATNGHGSMKVSLPDGSMVTGIFISSDSKDKVVDFYKGKLGSGASMIDTPSGTIFTLGKSEKESVMVTITAEASQNDGKTQIAIVHTKSNKSS